MKLGLVLAGGGGKGSYEIGVWKYLKEIGLDKKISVISGTSVGGLNAVLMATVDYKTAEYIWQNEIDDKILDTVSESRKNAALFSRTGLVNLLDKYVDLEKVKTSEKQIYVTCFNTHKLKTESFRLNDYSVPEIRKMLCATSAIPVAFQSEEIFGEIYVDGGVKDNVPLAPLLKEKCTHALIVNLEDIHTDFSVYDIKTVVLHPSSNLGFLFSGLIDFSLENSKKRIDVGYNDCKTIYSLPIKTLSDENESSEEIKMANRISAMDDVQILQETLRKIMDNPSLAAKIQCNINFEMKTSGVDIFWDELAEVGGWRFQRSDIFGVIRLLDPMDNRKAWGSSRKMYDICKNFLFSELKAESDAKIRYLSDKTDNSIEARLMRLKSLMDKNLITQSDYDRRKSEILKEI